MAATGDGAAWLPFMLNPARNQPLNSPTEQMANAVFHSLVATFANPLLTTEDPEELDWRIDAVLDDPEFGPRYLGLMKLVVELAQTPQPMLPTPADLTETWALKLGRENVPRLQRVVFLATSLFSAHLRCLTGQNPSGERPTPKSLLSFLDDWHLSADLKRIQLDSLRAEICMLALSAALDKPRSQPRWVIAHLLSTSEQGYWNHLRLVASLAGAEVSADVVPLGDRIDLSTVRASATQRQLSTELLTLKHIESKQGVFSPFGDVASDDD